MASTNVFDQLAANGNNPAAIASRALPPQPQAAQPSQSTDVFGQLAANGNNPHALTDAPAVSTPQQPSIISRVGAALKQEVVNPIVSAVTDAYNGTTAPPQDGTEHIIAAVGGGGGALQAYRVAKGLVDKATAAVKAKPAEFQQAAQDLQQAVQDFKDGHYVASAGDMLGGVTSIDPTQPPGVGQRVREFAQGVRPGGDLVTPTVKTAADLAMLYAGDKVADTAPAADISEATPAVSTVEDASAANPVQATVAKNVASAKLPAGEDLAANAQEHFQNHVAEEINQVADETKVARPSDGSAPDMLREVADAQYNRARAAYKAVDDATGGKFQPVADSIKNINDSLRDNLGIDPVQDAKLQSQKAALLKQQDALFDQAVDKGVSADTVKQAKVDFKSSQAKYDAANQLQMSALSDNPDLLNARTVTNRLTKFNVPEEGGAPSRLEQAVGADHASNLIEHAKTAQFLSKLPATESKALNALIEPNTHTSLFRGGATDWNAALKDFDSLGAKGQRAAFSNPEQVRNFLKTQGRVALGKKIGIGAIGALGGGAATTLGYELVK